MVALCSLVSIRPHPKCRLHLLYIHDAHRSYTGHYHQFEWWTLGLNCDKTMHEEPERGQEEGPLVLKKNGRSVNRDLMTTKFDIEVEER